MPYIGKKPANVPVTASDIPNDSITTAKIVDAAITIADIGPNAVGSSEMADDAVGLNELSATGTTNTSTFLRGDNSWAVPPDNNTVYTHPNHSGEVTSTADGAQVIADNVVDEANLKISNSPTNGQFLSAQSGNTGGLTWAAVPAGVGGATGVDFNDNVKARFGADNDLQIYHDHANSQNVQLSTSIPITFAANDLKFANGLNDTLLMVIKNDGDVGIGTASPASGRGIAGSVLHISDTPDAALRITDTGGSDFEISAETNTTLGTIDNTALNIITNNTNRMTIGNDGRVAIAQTGNATALQVSTSVAAETTAIFQGGGTGAVDVVDVRDSGGNSKFKVRQNGHVGIGLASPNHPFHVEADENYALYVKQTGSNIHLGAFRGEGSSGLDFQLRGTSNKVSLNSTGTGDAICFETEDGNEKMRIQANGNVGISETTPQYTFEVGNSSDKGFGVNLENNTAKVYIKANDNGTQTAMQFQNNTGTVGTIKTVNSATQFNTSSDYRLKENVDYTWDATARLKQLKPARFNFIADDTNTLVDGFLAHEVSSVVPEAISGEKDAEEMQGIDQSKLVPLLVKTIQELEARITALEA